MITCFHFGGDFRIFFFFNKIKKKILDAILLGSFFCFQRQLFLSVG